MLRLRLLVIGIGRMTVSGNLKSRQMIKEEEIVVVESAAMK
jgi:hypothetical protein